MKILETSRLVLRHFRIEDLEDLYTFYCDPEVKIFIPDVPKTFQETRKELEYYLNGHPRHPELGLWAAVEKESSQLVGRCGLLPWVIDQQDEIEIAYLIGKPFRNSGLATEAAQAILNYGFEQLTLTRLISLIDQENHASIRVAEKIGMAFEKEGHDEIGPFLLYSIHQPIP